MRTFIDVERVTWIQRYTYNGHWISMYVHLDNALTHSPLVMSQGDEGDAIWHAFLSLPEVHVFTCGEDIYAYNFANIDRSIQSGHWGGFQFIGDQEPFTTAVTLKSFFDDATGQAIEAYQRWLLDTTNTELTPQPMVDLTIGVPSEQREQALPRLASAFSGIYQDDETSNALIYSWSAPLEPPLSEERRMLLGLFEHVISVNNTRSTRPGLGPKERTRCYVSYTAGDTRLRRTSHRFPPPLGFSLAIGGAATFLFAAITWWRERRNRRET